MTGVLLRAAGMALSAAAVLALASCGNGTDVADGSCAGLDVTITGTPGDDQLRGTPGRDVVWGGDGDDRIEGLGGDDVLCGGPGADRLAGGGGDDTVDGGSDRRYAVDTESFDRQGDILAGGPGNDILVTGPSPGLASVDEVTYAAASSGVDVDLATGRATGEGHDLIRGEVGTLVGSPHDDRLRGSARAETMKGGGGSDRVDGRGGDDWLDAAGSTRVEHTARAGRDDSPNLLVGGTGDDTLQGAEGDDVLEGGDGDDALYGDLGADRLRGGAGTDTVNDYVVALGSPGAGLQALDGGAGGDYLGSLNLARPRATVDEPVFTGAVGTVDLALGLLRGRAGSALFDVPVRSFAHVETPYGTWRVVGTDGPNEIVATSQRRPVTIHARGGDDRLSGTFADDLLDGGEGDDVVLRSSGRDRYVDVETVRR